MLTLEDIAHNFGRRVAAGVRLLTKKPNGAKPLSESELREYFEKFDREAPAVVKIVKFCDTLHNLRTLQGCRKESQQDQLRAAREIILPLAGRLIQRLPKKDRWRAEYLKSEISAICNSYRDGDQTSPLRTSRVSA
jgi:(p)ppGpp synthase/HD superfamily hydrolase